MNKDVIEKNYTILHCHSYISNAVTNIDSVSSPIQLIDRAHELNMGAMALSEHGSVMMWIKKKLHMEEFGMKYIHAEEFYLTETLSEKIRDNYHCLLIAKNYDGVLELNKLSSKSFNREDNSFYYVPRITIEDVKNTSDNIIVSSACLGGLINKAPNEIKEDFIKWMALHKYRCYLEIQPHLSQEQIEYNQYLYKLSQQYNIPLLMCTDTHALNKTHTKGRAILQKAKNIHFEGEDEFYLEMLSYDELVNLCKTQNALPLEVYLEAIEETNRVATIIEPFELDYSYKYPHLWGDNSEQVLRDKIAKGLKRRKINILPNYQEYLDRIEYEMKAYIHNGAIDFMLLMEDIVSWCKTQDIQIGYGRGSVNGSIIAYLLGITEMDSIKHKLNFNRFMSTERVSLSDIDTDLPPSRIDEVKEYVFNKHGLYCSDIITFNTIALKGAIRDVGRALEIPFDEVGRICDSVETQEKELRKQYPELFEYVDIVNGCVVSVGNHPSGMVVSPCSIDDYMGLFTTSTDTVPISQINMKEVDLQNYVKLDLLKLNTIELIDKTCKLAGIECLTPDNIDASDINVWNSIRDDTTAIFQWESGSAQEYIKKLLSDKTIFRLKEVQPDIDYITLLSIGNGAIRPAGASYRDELANGIIKKTGNEVIDNFMKPTFGYLIFQCQIIQFLHECCGYTMGEADVVRRCVDENTLITMATGKRKKIKNIQEGEEVITIDNNGFVKHNKVNRVYANGKKETIVIKTNQNHIIKVTPNHQCLTASGWKEASKLSVGDCLMVPKKYDGIDDGLTPQQRLKCSDMFLIGMLLGDGCIGGNDWDIHFTNSDLTLINKFKECVTKRIGNHNEPEFSIFEQEGVTVNKVYSIRIKSKNYRDSVINLLKKFKLNKASQQKHLPVELMSYPVNDKLLSLLGGLFSTDGGYVSQVNCFEYYTISEELAYDIHFLLGKCGICSYVYRSYVNGYDYYYYKVRIYQKDAIIKFSKLILPYMAGNKVEKFTEIINNKITKDSATQPYYNYNLPRDCVKEIVDSSINSKRSLHSIGITSGISQNGSITDVKAKRVLMKLYCPMTYKLITSDYMPVKIKSIEQGDISNVYDLEVEKNHNYLADGLIVHNCFAKKLGTEQHIPQIKEGFIKTMAEKYNMPKEEADKIIIDFLQVIIDASNYLFSLNHSQPYSYEGYVCGWLRYYYPLQFLTVALNINKNDEEKTAALIAYAHKEKIEIRSPKFRRSKADYFCDIKDNCIYRGLGSIKHMSAEAAEDLYSMRDMQFKNFIDVLYAIQELPHRPDSRQLNILIKIGYFEEFGKANALLKGVEVFNKYYKCATIKLDKWIEEGYSVEQLVPYAEKITEKMARGLNNKEIILSILRTSKMPKTSAFDMCRWQIELLGYTTITDAKASIYDYIVINIKETKYGTVYAKIYNLHYGVEREYRCNKKYWSRLPLSVGDAIRVVLEEKDKMQKNEAGNWVRTGEKITEIKCWKMLDNGTLV